MTRSAKTSALRDHVDHLIDGWAQERPDLNVAPLAVIQRVLRLAAYLATELEPVFAQYGLTGSDFAVLANLRRSGAPYQLTQRDLMDSLRQTSGTVSLRINHLSERGLVRREPDPGDGRSVLVTLTDAGRELFDVAAPAHLANEDQLLAALAPDERNELARLLRILLTEFDQPVESRPDDDLGFKAAPAHLGQRRRAAVGLPPAPGILVESVQPHSWASTSGLTPGDLITKAGNVQLRSLTCLAQALAASPGGVTLTIQRGDRSIPLDPPPPAAKSTPEETRQVAAPHTWGAGTAAGLISQRADGRRSPCSMTSVVRSSA